ncbi:Lcl domain-containing protein [Pareuzebyella sediminis]|uniref:Lcl domain-containing protein n=1 Tax=Pareuzebyella sediminis TaxID=2607998 RepID=UPI0011EDD63A|nr:DUF1566 domain-containing protein [Pareuzebyella sediminis]
MNNKLKTIYLTVFVLFLSVACNNDDDGVVIVTLADLEVTLDENPQEGDSVGTVQTDASTSDFTIISQTPTGALSIDADSGELTVADATLFDFETNPTITATVTADNAENSITVTINLNNVSEVTAQALEVSLDENPTNGQVIGTLQTNGSASGFTLTSQSPTGAMEIDSNSGELTVADASLFDFETNPTLTATVSIEDAGSPVSVTVNLNDTLEITVQDFTAAVDENPTDGQVLGTVQATGNGTLSYSVTSQTPMGAMAIDATTGELTVIDPNLFDFETNPVITAEISVTDGAETTTATATINLNDVDEVTAQNTDLTIDENPSNGDVIGALQASGSNLSYAITFQNPAGAFNIDQNTGELSVADETLFDFETNPNMLATISVSNGIQTVSANAFVELNDVNEIGEYKYGGVIFWIDPTSNNSAGLVCALTDQGTNVSWGCQGTLIAGTSDSIGSGASNTAAIVTGCSTTGIAAEIAVNATIEGFTDWFLPSRGELNQMYLQKEIINTTAVANGGTAFIDIDLSNRYWSSSESNNNTAWCILFANGVEQGLNKGSSAFFNVRAVRAWTDF